MKWRTWLFGTLAVLCAILFIWLPQESADSDTRMLEVIALLQARDFQALEKHYSRPSNDDPVASEFWYFAHSDPANEEHLTTWVTAYPESAAARIARGTYYSHLASLSRGEAYISDTHADQLEAMAYYYAMAQADYHASLNLDVSQEAAYIGLLTIAMVTGNDAYFAHVARQGLAVNPNSSGIHYRMLIKLRPEWGGSLHQLSRYIEILKKKYADNPAFGYLNGHMSKVLAVRAYVAGNNDLALSHINAAIAERPSSSRLAFRANLISETDPSKALADLDRAIALSPDNADYRMDRAKIYVAREQFSRALEEIEFGLSLDPYEPILLAEYAQLLFPIAFHAERDGRKEEFETLVEKAFLSLERTRVYGGSSAEVKQLVAYALMSSILGHKGREKYVARALEAAPDNSLVWAIHTRLLAMSQQCDRRQEVEAALRTFQRICRGPDCDEGNDLPALLGMMEQACSYETRGRPNDPVTQWKERIVRNMRHCRQFYDEHDYAEAFGQCLAVAQDGNAAAQLDVSRAYMGRLGVPMDFAAAVYWAELAANQGDAAAQGVLGQIFVMGSLGEVRIEEGLDWIRKAMEQGSAEGFLGMGIVYHYGTGVAKDDDQAIAHLKRAVELGSEQAEQALEIWYAQRG